jgi:hypothetical protein
MKSWTTVNDEGSKNGQAGLKKTMELSHGWLYKTLPYAPMTCNKSAEMQRITQPCNATKTKGKINQV